MSVAGIDIKPTTGVSKVYESETLQYISGLTTELSYTQINLIDQLVKSLKSGLSITNLSDVFDVMYILAGETEESSLRNLVKDSHHATNVHSTAWTQYEGFKGDGLNDYLDTNYNANTQGVNFTLNNCSLGIYSRTNATQNSCDFDCRDDTYNITLSLSGWTNYCYARLNSAILAYKRYSNADSRGMHINTRNTTNDTGFVLYKNKTSPSLATSNSNTAAQIPSYNLYIGAANSNGSAISYTTRQYSFAFIGKHITTSMRDVIVDAIESYMDIHGKGVIS